MNGPDSARVCQGNGVSREIVGGEFVSASAGNDVLVGLEEVGKAHLLGLLDSGNYECATSIGLGDVDCEPEVNVRGNHQRRHPVWLVVKHVLRRERFEGANHRPADDVRERHLSATSAAEVIVDDNSIVNHELGGNRADARGRRDTQTRIHVGGESFRHSLQSGNRVLVGRIRRTRGSRCLSRNRCFGGQRRGCPRRWLQRRNRTSHVRIERGGFRSGGR